MSKKNMKASYVKSSVENNPVILGTYEGECADANITNLNGLDITREVWENVFSSEEYARGIEHGWFVGYLGHPDDPGYQNHQEGCIVMTEGHIEDNGKVYGKFNLINTPVGQIVKAFQDAGVKFGISVRGAGDIVSNSVDPDTFIFRGFDLVTFPAFPDSIPEFTAVAASADVEQQKKYKAVCAAVKDNIESLNTIQSVETIQSQFAKQSEEYQLLEDRKNAIKECETSDDIEECEDIDPRVEAMTQLYLDAVEACNGLKSENEALRKEIQHIESSTSRRVNAIERIFNSQIGDMNRTLQSIIASEKSKEDSIYEMNYKLRQEKSNSSKVQASLDTANSDIESLKAQISQMKRDNLTYKQKVEANTDIMRQKDSTISRLNKKLDETVREISSEKSRASNRDEKIASLKSKVLAAEQLVQEYQDAYANLYATALGAYLPGLSISATTNVSDLQRMIREAASLPANPDILEPTLDVDASDFDVAGYGEDDLISL